MSIRPSQCAPFLLSRATPMTPPNAQVPHMRPIWMHLPHGITIFISKIHQTPCRPTLETHFILCMSRRRRPLSPNNSSSTTKLSIETHAIHTILGYLTTFTPTTTISPTNLTLVYTYPRTEHSPPPCPRTNHTHTVLLHQTLHLPTTTHAPRPHHHLLHHLVNLQHACHQPSPPP